MRKRIANAFDRFIDVEALGDFEVAKLLHETRNRYRNRSQRQLRRLSNQYIQLSACAAPSKFFGMSWHDRSTILRLHYCGPRCHPGLASSFTTPRQVIYLPHTYMPNDRTRRSLPRVPSRADAGLPDTGFVFACQNSEYKITPEIFDVWMRLLKTVDDSVLWLKTPNPAAKLNLRREASARGVNPDRLLFAPRFAQAKEHLARLKLADLFLDTRPYNAHASACDALWAGVPIVTCLGNTFPGRVAASILHAVGLPEMITGSLEEYERLAVALAQDPDRLTQIKAKLRRNRDTEPLFDTARFTRDLECGLHDYLEASPGGFASDQFFRRSRVSACLMAGAVLFVTVPCRLQCR